MVNNPEYVAQAAMFLDKAYPGWYRNVSVDKLRMLDAARCVAGQNQMDWMVVGREFAKWAGIDGDDGLNTFAAYDETWGEEILNRQRHELVPA